MKVSDKITKDELDYETGLKKRQKEHELQQKIMHLIEPIAGDMDIKMVVVHRLYSQVASVHFIPKTMLEVLDMIRAFPPVEMCTWIDGCIYRMSSEYAFANGHLSMEKLPAKFYEDEGVRISATNLDTKVEWITKLGDIEVELEAIVVNRHEQKTIEYAEYPTVRQVVENHSFGRSTTHYEAANPPPMFTISKEHRGVEFGTFWWAFYTVEDFFDYWHNLWSKANEWNIVRSGRR